MIMLQQRLPLAVLKRYSITAHTDVRLTVATALTACGIETQKHFLVRVKSNGGCNSAYRLRY